MGIEPTEDQPPPSLYWETGSSPPAGATRCEIARAPNGPEESQSYWDRLSRTRGGPPLSNTALDSSGVGGRARRRALRHLRRGADREWVPPPALSGFLLGCCAVPYVLPPLAVTRGVWISHTLRVGYVPLPTFPPARTGSVLRTTAILLRSPVSAAPKETNRVTPGSWCPSPGSVEHSPLSGLHPIRHSHRDPGGAHVPPLSPGVSPGSPSPSTPTFGVCIV
jgi:hypothetical protein